MWIILYGFLFSNSEGNKTVFTRIILFILCFSPHLLIASILDQNALHSKGPAPSWVKLYNFPLEPVPIKPSQTNLQCLLIDTQRNWDEKSFYKHVAVKVLTQSGIRQISQISIDFDPSFSKLIFHDIRIYRDGKWSDRLDNSRYNLIQREKSLDQNIYNGTVSLVYFLDDIREGDIIEYSYSNIGANPLFTSHLTEMIPFKREYSIEKISHRLLAPPDFTILDKPINTTLETQIIDLSPTLREWLWIANETLPCSYESNQPGWYDPQAYLMMSQYKTWGEIIQKFYPLYTIPSDFAHSIPSEMLTLVEKWKQSTKNLSERALLALRFVQDEIRYLGIEEGVKGWQPKDPKITFQQRFGDCKDKTILLHTLLHLMDISSKPLLVHSKEGKTLPDLLPLPTAFNHVVLQIEIDGINYWVDPTIRLQGGSLHTNFFPHYEWGLLFSKNTNKLSPLPKTIPKKPQEIDTSFIAESEDSVRMNIKNVFYDFDADRFRQLIEKKGMKKFSEDSLSEIQETYGAVTLASPIEVSDNREDNIIIVNESYLLPTQKLSDKKVIKVLSFILKDYLRSRVNPERSSPYFLPYPLWIKEHIHFENPFNKWNFSENHYTQKHKSLLYTLHTQIENNSVDFNFELKHLQDHIPQTSLRDYWSIVNDINQKAPPEITIASLQSPPKDDYLFLFNRSFSIIGLFIWLVLFFISHRKKLSQDELGFNLNKFRKFYFLITILSIIFISNNLLNTVFIVTGIIILVNAGCNFVLLKRSVPVMLLLQTFLQLQTCYFSFLIFTSTLLLPERILAFIVSTLYLGYGLIMLNKGKTHLLEEKKALKLSIP